MVAAIVAAGGVGRRMGGRIHKPFVSLAGKPMLSWTLAALQATRAVREIVVVAHRKDLAAVRRMARRLGFGKVSRVVPGGASRMTSVFQGLKALPKKAEWVVVHDAARPLVTPALIHRTIRAASDGAAIAAVPVVPTIKEARDGWVLRTLDRGRLWAVQTPQVFRRDLLERAHRKGRANGTEATDDAALVEKLGWGVRIVAGSHRNVKVTTPEDLVIAEALLRAPSGTPRGRAGLKGEQRKERGGRRCRRSAPPTTSDEAMRRISAQPFGLRRQAAISCVTPPRRTPGSTPSSSFLGSGRLALATRLTRGPGWGSTERCG